MSAVPVNRSSASTAPAAIGTANETGRQHEDDTDRQGRGTDDIVEAERRGMNEGLILGEIVRRVKNQQQE